MAIDLIAKIAPKNDGFTGMVDADQVIGGGAAGTLPAATFPTTDVMPQYLLRQPTANVVINNAGGDYNFRIEGDTDQYLFNLDAGTDRIAIGDSLFEAKLTANKEETNPATTVDPSFYARAEMDFTANSSAALDGVSRTTLYPTIAAGVTYSGQSIVSKSFYFGGANSGTVSGNVHVNQGYLYTDGGTYTASICNGYNYNNIQDTTAQNVYGLYTHNQLRDSTADIVYGVTSSHSDIGTNTISSGYGFRVISHADITANGQYRFGLSIRTMPDPAAYTGTTVNAIRLGTSNTSRDGIWWGTDTNLYSSAANVLETDDTFKAGGYQSSDGSAGVTTTFTNGDGATVTVKNGLITAIV